MKRPGDLAAIPVTDAPPITDEQVYAVKAVATGKATDGQQKLAIDWIVRFAAASYNNPFRVGAHDATDFMCGRMFVGQHIVNVINQPIELLKPKVRQRTLPNN